MLMTGPAHLGKASAAGWLSQRFVCTGSSTPCMQCAACRQAQDHHHQLISWLDDPGETIGIEEVRNVMKPWRLRATSDEWRWLIIPDADRMTEAASNTLLKFLEDLPAQTTVILTSSRTRRLLPTIVSRATQWRWHLVGADDMRSWTKANAKKLSASQQQHVVTRAAGRPGWLINFLHDTPTDELREFFNTYHPDHTPHTAMTTENDSEQWMLASRETLLASVGSHHRRLWPEQATTVDHLASSRSVERWMELAKRALHLEQLHERHVQSKLLTHDLLLA